MLSQVRPALSLLLILTAVLGIAYPFAMTGVAGAVFPDTANGSLVLRDGQIVGSRLIGQAFTRPEYFKPRPSAAGTGYDASASSGTNLAPTSAKLADRLKTDADALRAAGVTGPIPADAITASGSGLDPDISPAFAEAQIAGVAVARGMPVEALRSLVAEHTAGRTFGVLGEPRVNVLELNLALDQTVPKT